MSRNASWFSDPVCIRRVNRMLDYMELRCIYIVHGYIAHTHTHTCTPWKKAIHLDDAFLLLNGRLDLGISARWSL